MKPQIDPRNVFLAIAYFIALVLIFYIFRPFISFMILGLLIVMFLYPLNTFLKRKVPNRIVSAGVMTFLSFIIVFVPLTLLVLSLTDEALDIYDRVAQFDFDEISNKVSGVIGFDINLDDIIFPLFIDFRSYISDSIPNILSFASGLFINLFVMFFVIYYGFKEGDSLLRSMMSALPFSRTHSKLLLERTKEVVRGVLYGQFLIAIIQGLLGGIGFWIFGVQNPVFWGFIMGILSFVPVVGPFMILVPASLYLMSIGDFFNGVGLLIYSSVVVMNVDNVLRPRIIGTRSNMHPLVVIVGILGGLSFFGLIGFILGPIALALSILIIDFFNTELMQKSA